ncbi:hypothetical protein HNY73_017266 [Argiope bruennichi]|uniref:Uncharacterized protein n=1 Tax=Argiope bruennichi TaxID=94029 RepID=A0A8T0ELH3_ARGBR|nr:hypothetical protein HNY73_017266 [Argiope bruennichi]
MLCYSEIFEINDRDEICMNYSTNAMNYLRSRLDKIRQERGGFSEHSYCLRVLFDLNCFVDQFNRKCSSLAKDTALQLIRKGGSLDDQCPVSIRLDILEFLDDLKVQTKQDIFVRQLLESER